jgi:hypothetical protein
MYRRPSTEKGVTGVVRILPDFRPGTEITCTGPIDSPRLWTRTITRFAGFSHRGRAVMPEVVDVVSGPAISHHLHRGLGRLKACVVPIMRQRARALLRR